MPGNEFGDRVHNFFAEDSLSQGQNLSQVVDGSWPVLDSNLWSGSQGHIGLPSPNSKNYNLPQSGIERGHGIHSFPMPHGLNLTQSSSRPEFTKSQSRSQQPNLNGYMHGHQILQTRQNETNFLGMDTESDSHNIKSRGLYINESLQGNGPENHITSVRSESFESPVSFDFFGNQQPMSGQQTGMLQSFPQQQSGFKDMQLLQQQLLLKKMQELQRQHQIQQLEARQQNSMNQVSSITKDPSGSHSTVLINGTPISSITEASNYSWTTEPAAGNANWLQHATSAIPGSSNGFRFSPEQSQATSLMGLVPQQVDQSLYGVPISNTRGTTPQYSHISLDKPPMQTTLMHSNSFPGNQYSGFPDQVSMQDESLVSRQGFPGVNMFGHSSGPGLSSMMNLDNLQQVNASQRNAPVQDFHERQELPGRSETLQENTAMQVSSSQNVVALDPTEQKILFGEDNIWDAFGSSSNMGLGGLNLSNGFPSVQSGSWSALMQSAVAETSSNDMGLQEEWSGLNSQNIEVLERNNQPLKYDNNIKQQRALADNNLQITSELSSGSAPFSDGATVNNSSQGVQGFQRPGQKILYEHSERLQRDSTCRSIQQSPEEVSKWLSRGPLQKKISEGSQIYENAVRSLDSEMNVKSISGSWATQQNVFSDNSGQPHNKPNGYGVGESISPGGDAMSKSRGNKNKLQHLYSNEQTKMNYEETSHGGHIGKADSGSNSTVALEHVKSAMGKPQVNREDNSLNNLAAIQNSNSARAGQDTNPLLLNSHHLNYWKQVDPSMKSKGSESSGKHQHHLDKGTQVLESSMNSSDKDAAKMNETENRDRKENFSDNHRSIGGSKENVWSDRSDSRNLSGGKQKLSGQAGRKTPGPRKFQYHPMGNLDEDVEPSYVLKQATNSQGMSQQIPRALYGHNEGYFGQSKFFGQFRKTSTETEKGHSPDLQGNRKGEDDAPSRGTFSVFVPNTSAPFDRSVGLNAPNKAAQSSQNMLELFHKVDQSKERGNSDGSVAPLQQNQSSASQGFGLQLAPPSQWLPVRNRALVSQSSAQMDSSFSSSHISPEVRDKGHAWLASPAQVQSSPSSHETPQGEFKNNKIGIPGQTGNEASQSCSMRGNFSSSSTSVFPHSRSLLETQQMIGESGKVETNQPINVYFDRDASHFQQTRDSGSRALTGQSMPASLPTGVIQHDKPVSHGDTSQPTDTNHSHERASTSQISVGQLVQSSESFDASGISQQNVFPKMAPNAWTKVSDRQHLSHTQTQRFAPSIFQPTQSNNNMVSTSSILQNQDGQDVQKGGNNPSEFGVNSMDSQHFVRGERQPGLLVSSGNADVAEKMSASHVKGSVIKNPSEACPSNSAATQRDIEAFGHSLKPNNFLHEKYSLLHQIQAMKDIDPSDRGLKRLKGLDSGLDCQIDPKPGQSGEHCVMVRDSSVHRSAVLSGDSNMLGFSGPVDNWDMSSQHETVPSQGVLACDQKDSEIYSCSNSTASVRIEHAQISPQMAPSWFNQFGTFKNGQVLPMHDARKNATIKTGEQSFTLGKPSDSLHELNSLEQVNAVAGSNHVGHIWQRSTPTSSVAVENFYSPQRVAQDVTAQPSVVIRPKKRRSATSELLPWHKEVTQGSQSLRNIRMAEGDWAKAANRLIDKVADEAEMIEDRAPTFRSKRRLNLTTKLMQQLFCPPPAAVLSADASSNYEAVAYLVARLALGDACSQIPFSGNDSCGVLDSTNLVGDQHLSKVMGDFIGRARKLENDIVSLEKRASVLDLRIESEDLEKYCMINRFAKFHGRGQADGAESSSSSDAAANAQRSYPQRYVSAIPVPRNLPERVHCLSL